jgi:hypothetical protein
MKEVWDVFGTIQRRMVGVGGTKWREDSDKEYHIFSDFCDKSLIFYTQLAVHEME